MSPRRDARAGEHPDEGQAHSESATGPLWRVPWWAGASAEGDREGHYPPLPGETGHTEAIYPDAGSGEYAEYDEAGGHGDAYEQTERYEGAGGYEPADGYDDFVDGDNPDETYAGDGLYTTREGRRSPKRRGGALLLGTLGVLLIVSIAVVMLGAGGSRAGKTSVTDGTPAAPTSLPAGPSTLDPALGVAAGTGAAAATGTASASAGATNSKSPIPGTTGPHSTPVAPPAPRRNPAATTHNPPPTDDGVNITVNINIP
jgi:hypothetical protein